jgi:cytoskeleton protein RodZ
LTPAKRFPNIDRNALVIPQGSQARTVGARLREAREKRGVSLRQIANSTRISVMSLEALERSDLARLPGGIFTRAFIRAYAEEVGLDPDRMIQDFIAELPPEAATATAHPKMVEDGGELESERTAVATFMRLMLVSIPIIGLIIYYGTHRLPTLPNSDRGRPGADDHGTRTAEPVRTSAVAPIQHAAPPAIVAPQAMPQAAGLSIEMTPTASCWVSVTADDEPAFSGLMNAGDRRMVTAKQQVLISVGDAGAFSYTVNGVKGRPLGVPGEVASKRITVSNLHEFNTP